MVCSTPDAKFMTKDISNFNLGTPIDWFEYMKMSMKHLPSHIFKQYNLETHQKPGMCTLKFVK